MNRWNLIYLLCLLFILGCRHTANDSSFEIIQVNINSYQEIKLSKLADNISSVELELTELSLVGDVIRLEKTKEFIFIFDSNGTRVLQFSNTGHFIKEIGIKGKGPKEYSELLTFSIDSDSRQIYLVGLRKVSIYDFDNNFVQSFPIEGITDYAEFYEGNFYHFTTKTIPAEEASGYIKKSLRYKYSRNFSLIDSLVMKETFLEREIYTYYPRNKYLSRASEGIFFHQPILFEENRIRDTLYLISENQLLPKLKLNFGNKLISENGRKTGNIKSLIRSDRFILSEYSKQGEYFFIYDLKEEKGYNLKSGINGGELTDNNTIYLSPILEASNEFYFTYKKQSRSSNYEPNPTIFFVKLKS